MAKKRTWQDLTDEELANAISAYDQNLATRESRRQNEPGLSIARLGDREGNKQAFLSIANQYNVAARGGSLTFDESVKDMYGEYNRRLQAMRANQPKEGLVSQPATTPPPEPTTGLARPQPQGATAPIPMPTLSATLPTRQEYKIDGRSTGIFYNPQEGMGRQATAQEVAAQQSGSRSQLQIGGQGSLTGAPNLALGSAQPVTLGVGPSIFQQYTPPSGAAVFGRRDVAPSESGFKMPERRMTRAEMDYQKALRGFESQERIARSEAESSRFGVETPEQRRSREESVAGIQASGRARQPSVAGVGTEQEQRAQQDAYNARVERQTAINTTRMQRGINSAIQNLTKSAGTTGITEDQKSTFTAFDDLQKEPTWKTFIKEMTQAGEFVDDPNMKRWSDSFNSALDTADPTVFLRNVQSLYDAWLKTK